jgi:tripartite-type tricarboxylate transporter receptor subunit TctC
LSPDFVAQNLVDSTSGTVQYAIACMPVDNAPTGSGELASVTFRAVAEGKTLVTISSALLADAEIQPIAAEIATTPSVIVVRRPGPPIEVQALIALVALAVTAGFGLVVWNAVKRR